MLYFSERKQGVYTYKVRELSFAQIKSRYVLQLKALVNKNENNSYNQNRDPKIPPTKIPPTKIPPTKIPRSENSTQRKFHPAKIRLG